MNRFTTHPGSCQHAFFAVLLCVVWPFAIGAEIESTGPRSEASREFTVAIRKAVLENPQVNVEWYQFNASRQAEKAARGALLPEVNLNASVGREDRSTPQTAFEPYDSQSGTFSIRQLLYGFAALETSKERKFPVLRSISN